MSLAVVISIHPALLLHKVSILQFGQARKRTIFPPVKNLQQKSPSSSTTERIIVLHFPRRLSAPQGRNIFSDGSSRESENRILHTSEILSGLPDKLTKHFCQLTQHNCTDNLVTRVNEFHRDCTFISLVSFEKTPTTKLTKCLKLKTTEK